MQDSQIYLISYPRSGNSWMRYCIELLFHRKTIDINKDYRNKTLSQTYNLKETELADIPPIIKSHKFIPTKNDAVIFLLRDFEQCISSHKYRGAKGEPKVMLKKYIELLRDYDNFPGKKLLLYYEDYTNTSTFKKTLEDLGTFLGEEPKNLDEFIKNYNHHSTLSKKGYKDKIGGERSSKNKVSDDLKSVVSKHANLKNKYLERYFK